jgi:hypothetical protein
MRTLAILLLFACPLLCRAADYNLATLTCDRYENEIVGTSDSGQSAGVAKGPDSIDMVMWLFGYTIGKAGEHLMYGDALTSFGFALDAECRNSPSESLLQALGNVRPKRDKPMDLMTLNCAAFESRHADSVRSDPDSANTIMMWLFGYSVGQGGGHMFDSAGVGAFADSLKTRCTQHTDESLYDALTAMKSAPRH